MAQPSHCNCVGSVGLYTSTISQLASEFFSSQSLQQHCVTAVTASHRTEAESTHSEPCSWAGEACSEGKLMFQTKAKQTVAVEVSTHTHAVSSITRITQKQTSNKNTTAATTPPFSVVFCLPCHAPHHGIEQPAGWLSLGHGSLSRPFPQLQVFLHPLLLAKAETPLSCTLYSSLSFTVLDLQLPQFEIFNIF